MGEFQGSVRADGQVVASNKVVSRALNQLPDLGALQMLQVVVIGSAQVSDHRAVVVGDDDSTATRRLLLVDAVLNTQTGVLYGIAQNFSVLVVANAAQEDDAVGWKQVLCAASSVLGAATGNQVGLVIVEEVLVQAEVLLFSEDGIVGLDAVLLEELLVAECLNV